MNRSDTRIIIIDSTRKNAEDLRDLLRDIGCPWVTLFASLDEARAIWERIHPDLAFIDGALLETAAGRRALSFIQEMYRIPVIVVVETMEERKRFLVETSVSRDYLIRPYEDRLVREAMEIALSRPQIDHEYRDREIWSLSALRAIHDGVILCDRERHITFMNPAAERITGWHLSEVANTSITRVLASANLFRFSKGESEPDSDAVDRTTQHRSIRSILTSKDGREKEVEHRISPFYDYRDSMSGYVILIREVPDAGRTDQQLANREELYRTLAETSRDFIYIVRRDGRLDFVNSSTAAFLGMRPEEMIGKQHTDLFVSQHDDERRKDHDRVFITGEARRADLRVTVRNRPYWLNTWLIPLKSADNTVHAVIYVSRDVTEQKNAHESVTSQAAELQTLNERKDRLLSILSHDLRSPFHSLLGFCELLQHEAESLQSDDVRVFSTELQRALMKQYELLENILAWSRVQLGGINTIQERFDFSTLVNELIEGFTPHLERKGLTLTNNVPPSTSFVADPFMVRSVMSNLISNAIKFTPRGGTILVAAEIEDSFCHISVRDTGVGIDMSKMKTLFDGKTIASEPGTENEPGTGLGLVLCKEMIERCGGSIHVDSYAGSGSTFRVTLPVLGLPISQQA